MDNPNTKESMTELSQAIDTSMQPLKDRFVKLELITSQLREVSKNIMSTLSSEELWIIPIANKISYLGWAIPQTDILSNKVLINLLTLNDNQINVFFSDFYLSNNQKVLLQLIKNTESTLAQNKYLLRYSNSFLISKELYFIGNYSESIILLLPIIE